MARFFAPKAIVNTIPPPLWCQPLASQFEYMPWCQICSASWWAYALFVLP